MFTKVEQIHADIKLKEQMQRAYVKNMWNHAEAALRLLYISWSHDSLTQKIEWLTCDRRLFKRALRLGWLRSELKKKNYKKKPESEHENHVIIRTIDFFKGGIKMSMQFTRVNRGTLRNV